MWRKRKLILLLLIIIVGCSQSKFKGQMDTPIEYSRFTNKEVSEIEYEKLISYLYEAEIMMRKPIEEARINAKGITIFNETFKTKNDLFEYYQTYLSNELADTFARKVSDLSKSKENQYLAVSSNASKWYSIYDADPNSIKVVQHTTVQSVVEMDLLVDSNTRLQYTIMKNNLGENPKIVQKTVLYE